MKIKIIQFGYGNNGKDMAELLSRVPYFDLVEIWDNDKNKHGSFHENRYPILSPQKYSGIPIVISVYQADGIKEQLIADYGFREDAIFFKDFIDRIIKENILSAYVEKDIEVSRKYCYKESHSAPIPVKSRVAIYTAIYGSYDELIQPSVQDVMCDFICFTDNKMLKRNSGRWRVIYDKNPMPQSRIQAKYFKLMSHKIFPRGRLSLKYGLLNRKYYDYIIWVDGNMFIKSPAFARDLCGFLKNDWALFAHSHRDCIYDEVNAAIMRCGGQPIIEQAIAYRSEGHPEHYGLWDCGVIIRKGNICKELQRFNQAWWDENLKWTYRDQISLPYLVRKHNVNIDTIHKYVWDNEWFDRVRHVSER